MPTHVRHLRERGDDVQQRQRPGGDQQRRGTRGHASAHVFEQLLFQPPAALLGAEHLGLVVLELRRHVALRPRERLPPHVLVGHPRGLRVADLDAVAEHAVEAHAQAREARARALALLETGDPAPRLRGVAHDGVQGLVPGRADHTAVGQREGRLVDQRGLQERAQVVELGERGLRPLQQRRRRPRARRAHAVDRHQAAAQRDEIPGVGDAEGGAAGQALEIADRAQRRAQTRARLRRPDEGADRVLPLANARRVAQRLEHPLAQQARAHRRHRLVERADE